MFDDLLSVFFPEHCRGCNISGTALCFQCQKTLRPAVSIIEPPHSFALFDYRQPLVQKAVWELKYHRKSPLAKKLLHIGAPDAMEYIASLLQTVAPTTLVIVPIPQHYRKTNDRGFNQSQLLATWLQKELIFKGAKVQNVLKKVRSTDAQAHAHSRQQRQKNLAHSMMAIAVINPQALYIVVDDVITTGSTITEASRALRAAGAKNICAIALAHGYKK